MRADLSGNLIYDDVGDGLHGSNRINCGNLDATIFLLLQNDVAGSHCSYFVLSLKRSIGELWIACAKDHVWTKIDIKPLLKAVFHIDLRNYSKIVPFKCFFCGSHRIVKSHVYGLREMVGHLRLLFSTERRSPFRIPCMKRKVEELPNSTRVSKKLSDNPVKN